MRENAKRLGALEILFSILLFYGSSLNAEAIHASAVIAVFVAGLTFGNYGARIYEAVEKFLRKEMITSQYADEEIECILNHIEKRRKIYSAHE